MLSIKRGLIFRDTVIAECATLLQSQVLVPYFAFKWLELRVPITQTVEQSIHKLHIPWLDLQNANKLEWTHILMDNSQTSSTCGMLTVPVSVGPPACTDCLLWLP